MDIADSTASPGNVCAVHYTTGNKIDYVSSAADGLDDGSGGTLTNRLAFTYTSGGKLDTITDAISRTWTFSYDTSNRFSAVNFPHDDVPTTHVGVSYTLMNLLATITDRDAKTWAYGYATITNKLSSVTDPGPTGSPYHQYFSFATSPVGGLYSNTYTDRRSKGMDVQV